MGSAASLQASVQGACVDELRESLAGLPEEDRNKLQQELLVAGFDICVCLPDAAPAGALVELSPFDRNNGNRAIPMLWFYKETLDPFALLRALREALREYPVFCGRFASLPTAVELNNKGVQLQVRTAAVADLSAAAEHLRPSMEGAEPSLYSATACDELFAPREDGDTPDKFLLAIRVTRFTAGGTAIGVCLNHAVGDADTMVTFVKNWSRCFRGLGLEPRPRHDRCVVNALSTGGVAEGEKPESYRAKFVAEGEQWVPEFAPVISKIAGNHVCVVPFTAEILKELKVSASEGLQEGKFVSRDDALTAHMWKAQCRARCEQLGLAVDSEEVATLIRACNIRQRTDPALGPGYCGNGVFHVFSELKVRELLTMPLSAVALLLRSSLQAQSGSEHIAACAQWLLRSQARGTTKLTWDPHGLSFMVSAWNFDWEGADFRARPAQFDHGANTFLVATSVPRPGGDGVNVYATGTPAFVELFVRLLAGKDL